MIITLSSLAAAFLKHDGKYLLMKRSPERKHFPNIWSGVGGGVEPHEMDNPKLACLREIYEETGISEKQIFNLELRYIIIRRAKDLIRQSYIYFGETDTTDFIDTDEGMLYWIEENQLLNREFSKTYGEMLKHYTCTPDEKGRVVVGVVGNEDGNLRISWSVVEDFE
ncbi:MAG: NUDIX domain-containing protein [Oscillospiraceae bacterium]|nr:NUDIX domain-containing protein [Oscillospiraceae bacterium]